MLLLKSTGYVYKNKQAGREGQTIENAVFELISHMVVQDLLSGDTRLWWLPWQEKSLPDIEKGDIQTIQQTLLPLGNGRRSSEHTLDIPSTVDAHRANPCDLVKVHT